MANVTAVLEKVNDILESNMLSLFSSVPISFHSSPVASPVSMRFMLKCFVIWETSAVCYPSYLGIAYLFLYVSYQSENSYLGSATRMWDSYYHLFYRTEKIADFWVIGFQNERRFFYKLHFSNEIVLHTAISGLTGVNVLRHNIGFLRDVK